MGGQPDLCKLECTGEWKDRLSSSWGSGISTHPYGAQQWLSDTRIKLNARSTLGTLQTTLLLHTTPGPGLGPLTYLQSQQHGQELPLVPYQHGTTDDGQLRLHGLLNGHRGHILPTRSDD